MNDVLPMLGFLGGFAALMAIIFASIYATKVINRKFPSEEKVGDRLAEHEARIADLEERVDFAERLLRQVREQEKLPPSP